MTCTIYGLHVHALHMYMLDCVPFVYVFVHVASSIVTTTADMPTHIVLSMI